mgnify:CR=1 FL=1
MLAAVFSNALLLEESISGIYLYDMSMEKIAEVGIDLCDLKGYSEYLIIT